LLVKKKLKLKEKKKKKKKSFDQKKKKKKNLPNHELPYCIPSSLAFFDPCM